MPLKGAETPYWLEARVEKLEVAIYGRLGEVAVLDAETSGAERRPE